MHKNILRNWSLPVTAPVAILCVAAAAQAQTPALPPDAGRLLQEQAPHAPRGPAPARPLGIEAPAASPLPQGVPTQPVMIRSVRIEGWGADVAAALPGLIDELNAQAGRELDFDGIRALGRLAQQRVRAAGYPLARSYLAPQDLTEGVLRIGIAEGRFGQITLRGPEAGLAWLRNLHPGDAVYMPQLERSLSLLADLPGVQVEPVMRAGDAAGTADLHVDLKVARSVRGEIGVDNHGSRYAGRERVRANVQVANPLSFGDELSVSASYSVEGTWLGSATYSLPLGANGLTGSVTLSRTDYQLGREFAALGASGTANVLSAQLSYPLQRSRDANLRLSAGMAAKQLVDARDATGTREMRRAQTLLLAASGDLRDAAGVSWGSFALTHGRLRLDEALDAADRAGAWTRGCFTKATLDAGRLQPLAAGVTLYGRLAAQWANKNLDSAEKLFLGGPYGVRAWPGGEGVGDQGALIQLELQAPVGATEPFVFYDAGRVRINSNAFVANARNRRSIAGAGLGLRWRQANLSLEGSVGWRTGAARTSTVEPDSSQPQLWLTAGYRF